MLRRVLTACALLTCILPFVASRWSRHQEIALRARGDVDIYKRQYYSGSRFTYYDVGLGACGSTSAPADYIVALNQYQFGSGYPGPQCYKWISIEYGGKTAEAIIVDRCEECPFAGLDFSEGLFAYFAPTDVGVLYGDWWYNEPTSTTTSAWEPPTTTTTTPPYTPPPAPATSSVSAYVPSPTTSSTSAYTPTSTSAYSTTTNTTLSTTTASVNSSTGWASATAVPAPDSSQNILELYDILIRMGSLLSVAKRRG